MCMCNGSYLMGKRCHKEAMLHLKWTKNGIVKIQSKHFISIFTITIKLVQGNKDIRKERSSIVKC